MMKERLTPKNVAELIGTTEEKVLETVREMVGDPTGEKIQAALRLILQKTEAGKQ